MGFYLNGKRMLRTICIGSDIRVLYHAQPFSSPLRTVDTLTAICVKGPIKPTQRTYTVHI